MRRTFVSLAVLLGSCAAQQAAPVSYGNAEAPARREAPPAPAPVPVSRAPGNETALSAYALQPGDVQAGNPTHPPRTHRVGPRETLYDIATRYQVPMLALIAQNHLEPPYALAPGRVIELPPARIHIVARDETLRDVATRYSVDTRSLALLNRLDPPYDLRAGQRIVLPALAAPHGEAAAQPGDEAAPAIAAGSGRFAWPARGPVTGRFGAQARGGRLDGIEIQTRLGASIAAAADGEVVYAGADLPAYGALILLRHADGYVTAYAHAARAQVSEGQAVRAGEPVAEAGERLLFQVRHGREAVDPLPLLGSPPR